MNNFQNNLNYLANMLQVRSYGMLLEDANNNDLMRYLTHQERDMLNKIIDQNEKIINQNQIIIDLLKEAKNES